MPWVSSTVYLLIDTWSDSRDHSSVWGGIAEEEKTGYIVIGEGRVE